MSAIYYAASGVLERSIAPLGFVPSRGVGGSRARLGQAVAVLLRVRRLFEAVKKHLHNRPQRPPPEEPEDYSDSDSIWDDPALWMLMMH